MLGIIVLVMLMTALARRAFDKGQNRWKWVAIGVAVWFGTQLVLGVVASAVLIAIGYGAWLQRGDGRLTFDLAGFAGAILGYVLLYRHVSRLPEPESNDLLISQLGRKPSGEEDTDHSAA
ncbi:MAG: hypothetical protein NW241_11440 [Bacteroidia bacterium]|nr:hypothetical protein [Bacteroidia bacterium]